MNAAAASDNNKERMLMFLPVRGMTNIIIVLLSTLIILIRMGDMMSIRSCRCRSQG
jgi:hypothetical protein